MNYKYEQEELRKIKQEYAQVKEEDRKLKSKKIDYLKPWTWTWWILLLIMALSFLLRFIIIEVF